MVVLLYFILFLFVSMSAGAIWVAVTFNELFFITIAVLFVIATLLYILQFDFLKKWRMLFFSSNL